MRWIAWRKQRYPNARHPVLLQEGLSADAAPVWRELHPGLTVAGGYEDPIAIWLVPYPGHAGGFLVGGRVQPTLEPCARTLADALHLFGDPYAAADHLLGVPHVRALLYAVTFDDLQGRVLLQPLPRAPQDYLEAAEADALDLE